jgi:hypothetical protein
MVTSGRAFAHVAAGVATVSGGEAGVPAHARMSTLENGESELPFIDRA